MKKTGVWGVTCLLGGCARSPSIPLLGAYFPDWLFCSVGALLLMIVLHACALRAGLVLRIDAPLVLLSYAALCAIFAMLGWLLIFQN